MAELEFDEIGRWSEVKLEIIRKYAVAYSVILSKRNWAHHQYIDAFAGPGVHISKNTGEWVAGSPLNALLVEPPFSEITLIDMDGSRIEQLKALVGNDPRVSFFGGDCNDVLLKHVFPPIERDGHRRALCLLAPYSLQLNWEVMHRAGQSERIEIFLNFPTMAMNRGSIWREPDRVPPKGIEQMNAFWGDDSWRRVVYTSTQLGLFGEDRASKAADKDIADAFKLRLQQVAGFQFVADPLPMRNSKGGIVYYLLFASPNATGAKIVGEIFDKYRVAT